VHQLVNKDFDSIKMHGTTVKIMEGRIRVFGSERVQMAVGWSALHSEHGNMYACSLQISVSLSLSNRVR
jgi:hypothetical protein